MAENVKLSEVRVDPRNARKHPEANLKAIQRSLERFGQQKPIVVGHDGTIIAGSGTYEAAKALGWETIEVVRSDLEGLEAKAFSIADNRTAELACWEDAALAEALAALKDDPGIDELVTGFSAWEIERAIAGLRGPLKEETEGVPAVPKNPLTRPGDLWILGEHRLLCGNSTKPEDVARLMDGEKAALLSTDPPYCVDYTGNDRPKHRGKDWSHLYREVDIKDLGEFLDDVFAACLPQVEPDAAVYIWHAYVKQPLIAAAFERHGLLLHQVIVWVKPRATFGHSYYRWRHEPCAFGWRRGHAPGQGHGQLDTVWELDWEGKNRVVGNEHPTQKPLRLFEIPMEQHTTQGAMVLEPFSGSGSQIIAAERLSRKCRAMEISPAFVDVAVKRWENFTGQKAVRKEG